MSTGHPPGCPECVPCQGDDCEEAAWCASETGTRGDLCSACWTEAMSGTDWDAADPLTTSPVETDAEYRQRVRIPGFDTGSNQYRRNA